MSVALAMCCAVLRCADSGHGVACRTVSARRKSGAGPRLRGWWGSKDGAAAADAVAPRVLSAEGTCLIVFVTA